MNRPQKKSEAAFARAQQVLVGGVNSPVRAFRGVGGTPLFIQRAAGARIWDIDGNEYIDYVASWGPMITGHAHPNVVEAVRAAAVRGTSYGAPTEVETELAELVCARVPSIEKLRFVSSGTEAAMSAIRLARGVTGRDGIIKLEGCYHGASDSLLVKAGSGALTLGLPDSPGVPADLAKHTHLARLNDLASVRAVLNGGVQISAVLVEPVAGNCGVIPPADGYLQGLRDLCDEHGALLIFDEVMTGFRVAPGGAQERYGVKPDITCLGKIIGGGLPVGAYGASREIMDHVAPEGPIYQAGTLSGNPLAMNAGLATLKLLGEDGVYEQLDATGAKLTAGLQDAAAAAGVPLTINRVGSMLGIFFSGDVVTDFAGAKAADSERYARFFHAMLARGVYFAPSAFEAAFVGTAHGDAEIDQTIAAAAGAFEEIAG